MQRRPTLAETFEQPHGARRRRLPGPGRGRRPAASRRGSALLLVVVLVVVMMLLGIAYLQVARLDQVAAFQPSQSNINVVAAAVVADVQQWLHADLFDDSGQFLNPSQDESFDYPYTDSSGVASFKVYGAFDVDGVDPIDYELGDALGGELDDMWLASTTPDFSLVAVDEPVWRHISNPYGIFLRIPKVGASVTRPEELPVNFSGSPLRTDTDVLITSPTSPADTDALDYDGSADYRAPGGDADGDGVLDSRYTWAPIRIIGDTAYVMNIRVVDLSSMLNLNIATAATSDGSTAGGRDNLRGHYPASADLSRLMSRVVGMSTNTWQDEIGEWTGPDGQVGLFYRRGGDPLLATVYNGNNGLASNIDLANYPAAASYTSYAPGTELLGRVGQWLELGSLWGYDTPVGSGVTDRGKYGLPDEWELRHRWSINALSRVTPLENQAPELLGRDAGDQADFLALDYTPYTSAPTSDDEKRLAFFRGYDGGGSPTQPGDVPDSLSNREWTNIRHLLTTQSGAAVYAPNHDTPAGGLHAGRRVLQYDLAYRGGRSFDQAVGDIADLLFRPTATAGDARGIFAIGNDGDPSAHRYLDLRNTAGAWPGALLPSVSMEDAWLERIANVYAGAIADYIDRDSVVRHWTDGSSNLHFFSLETLPFLSEAYIQAEYDDVNARTTDGIFTWDTTNTPIGAADLKHDTWEIDTNKVALAVEIRNPFDREIRFRPRVDPFDSSIDLGPEVRLVIGTAGSSTDARVIPFGELGRLPAQAFTTIHVDPKTHDGDATAPDDEGSGDVHTDLGLAGTKTTHATLQGSLTDLSTVSVDATTAVADPAGAAADLTLPYGGIVDEYNPGGTESPALEPDYSDESNYNTADDANLASPGPIVIALQVNVGDISGDSVDDWITYDRITHPDFTVPRYVTQPQSVWSAKADSTPDERNRLKLAIQRDAQGVRYLSNAGLAVNERLPTDDAASDIDDLEAAVKSGVTGGDASLDDFQLIVANRPMLSTAELGWIHMFGFGADLNTGGPYDGQIGLASDLDFPSRLRGPDGDGVSGRADGLDALDPRFRFLEFDLTKTPIPDSVDIPHAAIVMDQFTTLSPRHDGVDNDDSDKDDDLATESDLDTSDAWQIGQSYDVGDVVRAMRVPGLTTGNPDGAAYVCTKVHLSNPNNRPTGIFGDQFWRISDVEREQFVPGTVNVNTAPLEVLTYGAPLNEPVADIEALMKAITDYRDSGARPAGMRLAPGIASVGELLYVAPSSAPGSTDRMTRYGEDAASQSGGALDVHPLEEEVVDTAFRATRIAATDSPEEKLARFYRLRQWLTTRSDVYAAYFHLQGFPAGDFRKGPTESRRYVALFSRAGVVEFDDPVRVLAVWEVD